MRKTKRAQGSATRRKEPRKLTLPRPSEPQAITMECRECLGDNRETRAHYSSPYAAQRAGWYLGERGTTFLGICPDCVREAMEERNRDHEDEINRGLLWLESYR